MRILWYSDYYEYMPYLRHRKKISLLNLTLISYCYYIWKVVQTISVFLYGSGTRLLILVRTVAVALGLHFSWFCGVFFGILTKPTLILTRPFSFSPPLLCYRSLGLFIIVSLILLSPFGVFFAIKTLEKEKISLTAKFQYGVSTLERGAQELQKGNAQTSTKFFTEAHTTFQDLSRRVHTFPLPLRRLIMIIGGEKGKEFRAAETVFDLAFQSSSLGLTLAQLVDEYKKNGSLKANVIQHEAEVLKISKDSLLKNIIDLRETDIPQSYRNTFLLFKEKSKEFNSLFDDLLNLGILATSLSGIDESKRYLIIFQNNTELRATGGFMGSFALVDIRGGKVATLHIPSGGSYDIKGSLSVHTIPPFPLLKLIGEWQFQDANWFPDFPTSAKKIQWFFSKSDGPTLDGIIAINASFAKKILALTGPLEMRNYKKTITSENVIEEIEKAVELEYDPTKELPKQFLADLVPEVLSRLSLEDPNVIAKLLSLLPESAQQKEIQLFLNDSNLEHIVTKFGFAGEIKKTQGDYLAIIHSNIGGRKTDSVMNEIISHDVLPQSDGSLTARVTIQRTHKGIKGNFFNGVPNIDYLRIYVPQGSTLMRTSGFDLIPQREFQNPASYASEDTDNKKLIQDLSFDSAMKTYTHKESEKTVFSGWIVTPVGETKKVNLTYKLPFTKTHSKPFTYSLITQHQSGSQAGDYRFRYIKNSQEKVLWTNRNDVIEQKDALLYSTKTFDRDIIIGIETQEDIQSKP